MGNNKVLLLTIYNEKAPGVRYLANYLIKKGFDTKVVFLKGNIYNTQRITEEELSLLKQIIEKDNYLFIGLSILSSFTIIEIKKVIEMIKNNFTIPLVIGGAYPTIMHEQCAKLGDIVIRGEGELSIVELATAFSEGKDWKNIPNLCYIKKDGEYIQNEIAEAVQDLDEIGYPLIGNDNMCLIDSNKIIAGDPQLNTDFYEITCSRGCPFNCSYCYSSKFRSLYKGKGKYLRFRSVNNVMEELTYAIKMNPKIKEIRFWDEVFTTNKKWVIEFANKYKKEIGLRFVIWGHPLLIEYETLEILVNAGLRRIIVGFQTGSPNVRNNIFKRPETNEQIIEASKILSAFPQLEVYYDLIICHVLESLMELKETFDLCLKLHSPFGLQIHGLSFLPKTDIIQTLIEKELYTEEELNEIFNASFEENYRQWNGPRSDYYADNPQKEVWADLIYLTQYRTRRNKVIKLSKNATKNKKTIKKLKRKMENLPYEIQEKMKRESSFSEKIINFIKTIIDKRKTK